MATQTRNVMVRFNGDSRNLDGAAVKGGKSIDKFSAKVSQLSVGILAGAGAVVVGLAAIGDKLDGAYDTIRVGTGKTGAELESLNQSFKNVAKVVPAELDVVSTAIAELSKRTGAQGAQLEALATAEIRLAQLTGADLGSTIAATTRLFGDWSIASGQQVKSLDKLFRAGQKTGIGVDVLAAKLVQFGAPLRQLGFDFDESVALLAKWEKEGVNTELVLGGLKKALGTFAKAGKDPVKALQDLIKQLAKASSTAEANKIAVTALGVKAGPDFAAAVREGRFGYEDLMKVIQGGTDTLDAVGKETDDWKESLLTLKNNAILALEPAAIKVFGFLNDKAVPALKAALKWTQENTGTVKTLAITLGSIAAVIVTVSAAIKAYEFALNAMKVASALATAVTWALDAALWAQVAALLANPITWIVLGIIATIAAIIVLIKYWDEISAFLQGIGRWFVLTFWGQWLKPVFVAWQQWLLNVAKWFQDLRNKIIGAFIDLGQKIASPFLWAFNKIADAWNGTVGRLSWTVPNWVPGIGGNTISAPKLPNVSFRERGGRVRKGHPYIVGEAGPELFNPDQSGRVEPNSQMDQGGGSRVLHVTVVIGGDEFDAHIEDVVDERDKRTARAVVRGRPRAAMGAA